MVNIIFKQIITNANKYGDNVSTQDWLKFLAIITMTIDHIGWCFIAESNPYYEWFRVIGRTHVPIWFFFAGYSLKNKCCDKQLLSLAIWLVVINIIGGRGILGLNVLFSIIICRACVLWLRERNLIDTRIWDIFLVCAVFSFITSMLFEYGTTGVLYAVMGNMVRHRIADKKNNGKIERKQQIFFIATFALFMFYQYISMDLSILQSVIMTLGVGYSSWRLSQFEMRKLPWFEKSSKSHYNIGYVIRLLGRNSLYYYVIHRTIFILASYYGGFHHPQPFPILGIFGL